MAFVLPLRLFYPCWANCQAEKLAGAALISDLAAGTKLVSQASKVNADDDARLVLVRKRGVSTGLHPASVSATESESEVHSVAKHRLRWRESWFECLEQGTVCTFVSRELQGEFGQAVHEVDHGFLFDTRFQKDGCARHRETLAIRENPRSPHSIWPIHPKSWQQAVIQHISNLTDGHASSRRDFLKVHLHTILFRIALYGHIILQSVPETQCFQPKGKQRKTDFVVGN
jgi:hypothetical protein